MSTFSSISSYSHWRFLAKITLFQLLPLFNYFILLVEAPCPFQNPFWFVDKPMVASVFDENGEMVPNKVRVMWNRMENFKCVDYFQVIMFFYFFLVFQMYIFSELWNNFFKDLILVFFKSYNVWDLAALQCNY